MPRLELFAQTRWNDDRSAITSFNYDPGALEPLLTGLDYRLMAQAFSDFSDLRIRQFAQVVGGNYRLSDDVVLNGAVEFSRYWDKAPYLFDTNGRFVTFVAGVNWVF